MNRPPVLPFFLPSFHPSFHPSFLPLLHKERKIVSHARATATRRIKATSSWPKPQIVLSQEIILPAPSPRADKPLRFLLKIFLPFLLSFVGITALIRFECPGGLWSNRRDWCLFRVAPIRSQHHGLPQWQSPHVLPGHRWKLHILHWDRRAHRAIPSTWP